MLGAAGLGRGIGVGSHEPAEDYERGQAAHAAAVEDEHAEVGIGHGGLLNGLQTQTEKASLPRAHLPVVLLAMEPYPPKRGASG